MISLHLTRGDNYEGVYLQLPATPAEVGEAYAMLDSISRYAGETHIVDVKGPVKNLAQFIKSADLAKREDLEKLNRLAKKIDSMSASEQTLLSGALCTESINGLDDVLRVADRLEDYEIIPEVTCDRELGGYVVEHGLVMDFPEAVRPYLDYVGIGAEYYADHGGAYTMDGYVKRRDGQPEQVAEHTVFSAYLSSHCGARRLQLFFPATDETLEGAKQRLQIDSFAEAEVETLNSDILYLVDLLPAACISAENINELALAVEEMKQTDGETLKYLSVLSVEQPEDFPAALRLAIDLDDYERITEGTYEYGQSVLRRIGADDELLDTIEGYMDFEKLGEDSLVADGVRQTEFGLIRRCSSPFSEQAQEQQKYLRNTMC
jgi:hypothetical protein